MKHYLDTNVFEETRKRLEIIFDNFEKVCVSFSGGKDSGVLVQYALQVAREKNKLPLHVMHIDLEGWYRKTEEFVERIMTNPDIKPYWICLPIHLRNSVSQFQPHWICWDDEEKEKWIRPMPDYSFVISDVNYFPFFRKGMEFEEFVPLFGNWFSEGKQTAILVAIRSDESLNRYRTIKSQTKIPWGYQWTTTIRDYPNVINAYPIYDWRTEDIWIASGKMKWDYNKIYDLMYLAGLTIHQMRLCQPYGDDQRKGLWLFKMLEPETWTKVVSRVQGANFGNRYVELSGNVMGNIRINLPEGYTWKSYAEFLLETMPKPTAEHYRSKINKFLDWWKKKNVEVPDQADPHLEAMKKAPSWRRICKCLLKNDFWCKGLSFSETKREMEKQMELILKYTK